MKKSSMKKLFTAVMAASMVMASSAVCFAGGTATTFNYPDDGEPGDNVLATEVSYVASEAVADYTVTVPQSIVIPGGTGTGLESADVTISGITTADITVTADDTIEMTSNGGTTLTADVSMDSEVKLEASAASTATEATSSAKISAAWAATQPEVDNWTGTIHYTVAVAQ